ncbi:MAG: hypothetical protein K2H95_08720 [Bacteroidales bacterium]|nr:hypothetical protein [Bacteroidales bacterium]
MTKVVDQIISIPDKDYPQNYGSVTVVVRDTVTGESRTASCDYHHFKSEGDATSEAIQDAINKL